jgi:regulator of ribonuclease activity A
MLDGPPSTSDLVDEHGDGASVCLTPFVQYGARRQFAGPISTVRCHEDNVIVRRRVGEPGAGRVLVVDGGGSLRVALVGDMLAGLARDNGWAGLVINGCVRDVSALAGLDLGIKALAACPRPSVTLGDGESDVEVSFGGVTFTPEATLVSDEDGIVLLDPPH